MKKLSVAFNKFQFKSIKRVVVVVVGVCVVPNDVTDVCFDAAACLSSLRFCFAVLGCGLMGSTLMGSLQKYYFLTDLEKVPNM